MFEPCVFFSNGNSKTVKKIVKIFSLVPLVFSFNQSSQIGKNSKNGQLVSIYKGI